MTQPNVHRHDRRFGYAMIAPAVAIILFIGLFPLIWTLLVSVQNISMIDEDTSFQGLLNYQRLMSDTRFWEALGHTLLFTAVALPLELILGLALALLFLEELPGRPVFVALLVLPTVISPIVAGAAWRLLFDNRFGPINQVISWVAGEPVTILWLNDPNFVYAAILIAEVWQWTPFMFLLLFASLTNVDPSLGEAARIDGAGFWRTLWSITLPVIRPVIVIALLIRGLDLFRIFDVIWALTKGGPGTRTETISIYAYVQGFQQFETSYTAAMAFVIIVILTMLVMAALKRVEIAR
ncbi:MAG TPA: sugar ABC transporter permease [Geminicoccus sp.]|uniref:carbohydrate ABC transporter permease n=1 Tax=Geminicoccus sp. TaxID=2024832 RepID=UPI002C6F813D|nr:sugar ABC transporter permease [Geminicoccus sp.]HWL67532.1 sugar ABC transporter permease [Geminicoccus sp.]